MTAAALIKILKDCNPRADVRVFLPTFKPAIVEFNCLSVETAAQEHISKLDGDGFMDCRKDGTEKQILCVILRGDHEINEGI